MNSKNLTLLGILLFGILLGNLNYIIHKKGKAIRLDFTQQRLFTLSEGSRAILSKLSSPLKARLYYAKTASLKGPEAIRYYNNYFTYVRELLEEYEYYSAGKLKLEVIDPRPDTEDEENALKYGLKRYQITEDESFYFGLAILNEAGNEEVIPFFSPDRQEFLEYDLSKVITTVNQEKRLKIGILSSLPVMGDDMNGFMAQMMRMQGKEVKPAWTAVQVFQQLYAVEKIETTAETIPDVDVLLVIHPKSFGDTLRYAIDQYVLRGGKAIFFVDNYCYVDEPVAQNNPLQGMVSPRNSSINELLKGWGVEQVADSFPGDKKMAKSVPLQPFSPPQPFLGFLDFAGENMNRSDVVTAQLKNLEFIFPAGFRILNNATDSKSITFTPLLETSEKGNFFTMDPWEFQQPDAVKLLDKFTEGKEKIALGVKVTGPFQSNFKDGPPKKGEGDKKETPPTPPADHLQKSKKDSTIIVFGDVDFMTDNFAFTKTFFGPAARNENHVLVLNAIDNIAGSNDLIKIRARGEFKRPFTTFQAIERDADTKTADRVKEINGTIKKFQDDLNAMQAKANEENVQLLQAEVVEKQKKLKLDIAQNQKLLRGVKRERRQDIEMIENRLRNLNLFLLPCLLGILMLFSHSIFRRWEILSLERSK